MNVRNVCAVSIILFFLSLIGAPSGKAMPGPICPGNGNDTVFIGADGGWCEFMFMPDGSHVSCRWADWSFLIGDIGGRTECRRVDDDENLLPDSPPWGVFTNWGDNEREPPPMGGSP